MRIWKYKDYEEYVEAQVAANKKKLKVVFVKPETIKKIYEYKNSADYIICHGTRNGKEQKLFQKLYECDIIGTEISDTAKKFPMTVQHDFHEQKEEWIGKFDILYTNSFDHSYDPEKAFTTWRDQIKSDGIMVIELTVTNIIKESDPLDISEKEFLELVNVHGCNVIGDFKSGKISRTYIIQK